MKFTNIKENSADASDPISPFTLMSISVFSLNDIAYEKPSGTV
jgi:hypothetical protein